MGLDKVGIFDSMKRNPSLEALLEHLLEKERQQKLQMTHPETRRMILILEEGLPERSHSAQPSRDLWRLDPPILSRNGFQI